MKRVVNGDVVVIGGDPLEGIRRLSYDQFGKIWEKSGIIVKRSKGKR